MKPWLLSLLTVTYCSTSNAQQYKNPTLPIATRVSDLLSRMTLEEKIGQLNTYFGWEMYKKSTSGIETSQKLDSLVDHNMIGSLWGTLRADPWTQKTLTSGLSVTEAAQTTNLLQRYAIAHSRLGIPLLLHEEAPHGMMAIGATVFPTGIGLAGSFDTTLMNNIGKAVADEIKTMGSNVAYGPILDVAREPRWSRVEETYGEDPFLIGEMGSSMVKGLTFSGTVVSTLKHFAAYGMSLGGQNGGPVSTGRRDLLESILPPFKKAILAGANSIMTSYNSIDGYPCSANRYLLKEILRENWHFKGSIISDLGSIEGLYSTHNIVSSLEDAAATAINAGVDINLGNGYNNHLLQAVNDKKVSISVLDSAVAHVLQQKFELGLFEHPYVSTQLVTKKVHSNKNVELAYQAATESVVLLKNDSISNQSILPLDKNKYKKLAIIGPNADTYYNQIGDYSAPQPENKIITVWKAFHLYHPEFQSQYIKGCSIRDTTQSQIEKAVQLAQHSDVVILVVGGSSARDFKTKYINTGAATVSSDGQKNLSDMESGEGYDRSTLSLMGDQLKLFQALTRTGKPIIVVSISGRPLLMNEIAKKATALLQAWYPGEQGGKAIADIIAGKITPSGKLSISIPLSEGTLPDYYNQLRPEMHPYVESKTNALFSFGYGLSYVPFKYSNLNVAQNRQSIQISCKVENEGKFDADNVTEVFVKPRFSVSVQPFKALKAFARTRINKNSSANITLSIVKSDLEIVDENYQWQNGKGIYDFWLEDGTGKQKLAGSFTL